MKILGDIILSLGKGIIFTDSNGYGCAIKMDGENLVLIEPEDSNRKWLEFKDDDGLYVLGTKVALVTHNHSVLESNITLGDGATGSIIQNNGSWWQKILLTDTSELSIHRFQFQERQGSGDYIELFGIDGYGELYAKGNKVWHIGNFNPNNYEPVFLKNTAFNKNFGNSSGTICEGNDSRLSDPRTPLPHGHNYLPLAGGSLTGDLIISAGNEDRFIYFDYTDGNYDWRIGYLGTGSGNENFFTIQSNGTDGIWKKALDIGLLDQIVYFINTPKVSGNDIWHAGNDGPDSGLNADLLDGKHASEFANTTHAHIKAQITDMPTKLSQFENDIGAGAGLNIVCSSTEPSVNPGDWWYKEI